MIVYTVEKWGCIEIEMYRNTDGKKSISGEKILHTKTPLPPISNE